MVHTERCNHRNVTPIHTKQNCVQFFYSNDFSEGIT